jgi:transposase-like protein
MRERPARRFAAMQDKGKRAGGKKWTAEQKLRIVLKATDLSDEELGAFLRREGVHEAQLKEWTKAATTALSSKPKSKQASPETKRIRALEKELRRKEKALAETAALLALKKKLAEIWGDEDDDTSTRSGT